jgi:hypothetical protein
VVRAAKGRFESHKRIARWTWPMWMYVSVTGVLIYLLLYQIFPQSKGAPAADEGPGKATTSLQTDSNNRERDPSQ